MSEKVNQYFILPNESSRTKGQEAQRMNIQAARLVADMVRTTLGPKGMDKMVVDAAGDVTVTNDGVTILREMNIEHPTAKMVVDIARTQEMEVGDGTTTAVIIAGELLRKAEGLLDQDIHPTIITRGFTLAAETIAKELETMGTAVNADKALLAKVAMTATTGKGAETAKQHLASLVVDAVLKVAPEGTLDKQLIDVVAHAGAVANSEIIDGIILEKERVHPSMPKKVVHAKVLLLNASLEIKNTETDAKISITDPEKLQAFIDMEERMLARMVEKVQKTGATVLVCQKGIDDIAQHYLAKAGIFAVRRASKSALERLAAATGATIVSNIEDISDTALGAAGTVEQVAIEDEPLVMVKQCPHPKSCTILVRGSTAHVREETKRAVEDALGVVAASLRSNKLLPGAGAPEMSLARHLRTFAASLPGREQLAVMAFADALEVVPRTLAENAGIDPIDAIAELKAAHEQGKQSTGIDIATGRTTDAWQQGIVEPVQVKQHALQAACDVAVMILRIDDVISAEKTTQEQYPGMQ